MSDQWLFKSETYDNCNCAVNCGCQFNLPSTHGYCQSAFIGTIVEGHFKRPLQVVPFKSGARSRRGLFRAFQ